jgi:Putative exonuclease SbcCD, C subunit
MNAQLGRVRTASDLQVRLRWQVDPELPAGTTVARELLLTDPHKLTDADRRALHGFLKSRIEEVRAANTVAGWEQQLLDVLDYTRWHRFVVQMDRQDGGGWIDVTKRRHAALSGGEKAIVLHLPLFAAAAAHYRSAPEAPRLILLDEVFVGVDTDNRGQLLRLLVEFDLDLVLTSDHEWCTYAELDGIAIHQLMTGDGDDAVTTARFVWDGFQVLPAEPAR